MDIRCRQKEAGGCAQFTHHVYVNQGGVAGETRKRRAGCRMSDDVRQDKSVIIEMRNTKQQRKRREEKRRQREVDSSNNRISRTS